MYASLPGPPPPLCAGILFPNFGMQFSAKAIVSLLIEYNLHPQLNPMIPSILINSQCFVIVLFDAQNDIPLISEEVTWRTQNTIKQSGLMLLWAVFHYR